MAFAVEAEFGFFLNCEPGFVSVAHHLVGGGIEATGLRVVMGFKGLTYRADGFDGDAAVSLPGVEVGMLGDVPEEGADERDVAFGHDLPEQTANGLGGVEVAVDGDDAHWLARAERARVLREL